jgi:hypothetical protein
MNGKSTTASSISEELAGTLQMARYTIFQCLRRCTNVILASAPNSDLKDNKKKKNSILRLPTKE